MEGKPVQTDPNAFLPLKPVDFLVLMVLLDGDRHGYGLVQEIAERSNGTIKLVPGNFYAVLKRLMESGLLGQSDKRPAGDLENERRRYYAITPLGKQVAKSEALRLKSLVHQAEASHLISDEVKTG